MAAGLRVLSQNRAQAGPINLDVGGDAMLSSSMPAFWTIAWVALAGVIIIGLRIGYRGVVAS